MKKKEPESQNKSVQNDSKDIPEQKKAGTKVKREKKTLPPAQRFILYVIILLTVFLLGFLPIWMKYRTENREYLLVKQQLTLSRIENSIAAAVINARQADYEAARQAVSKFFTALQEASDSLETSGILQQQQEAIRNLFADRDEIITLLAREDETAVSRLSALYAAYSKILNSM